MPTKNSTYTILSLILLILTVIGGYFLFQVYQSRQEETYTSQTTPKIELIPTDAPETEIITDTVTPTDTTASATIITPAASISGKVASPTSTTTTPAITKALTPTKIPTAVPTSSSAGLITYSSAEDDFSVEYASKRKIYQDTEASLYTSNGDLSTSSTGTRYTFYLSTGNFAVHVTSGDLWSWKNVNRQFDNNSLVAGKPSFRYDITSQTIVDLKSGDKNYTIQCIHNGNAALKTECEAFISSFKLL